MTAALSLLACIGVFGYIHFRPTFASARPQVQTLPTVFTGADQELGEAQPEQGSSHAEAPVPQGPKATAPRQTVIATGTPSSAGKVTSANTDSRSRSERQARLEQAMRRVQVKVYYTHWCPACTKARAWLDANGVSYSAYDVENDSSAKKTQRQLNPSGTIPTIDVDGIVLIGFSSSEFNSAVRRAAESKLEREYIP
jgi:glutaredoxin